MPLVLTRRLVPVDIHRLSSALWTQLIEEINQSILLVAHMSEVGSAEEVIEGTIQLPNFIMIHSGDHMAEIKGLPIAGFLLDPRSPGLLMLMGMVIMLLVFIVLVWHQLVVIMVIVGVFKIQKTAALEVIATPDSVLTFPGKIHPRFGKLLLNTYPAHEIP